MLFAPPPCFPSTGNVNIKTSRQMSYLIYYNKTAHFSSYYVILSEQSEREDPLHGTANPSLRHLERSDSEVERSRRSRILLFCAFG